MTNFAISADIRNTEEKLSNIRGSKRVPGVVYGATQAPISLTVDSSDFLRLFRKAGESNIVKLSVWKKELEVLIHDTQKQAVTGDFTHVDFYAITRGQKLSAAIHFNFIGNAPAAKEGLIIQEVIREIEVRCLPRDLVDHFDIDLSVIKEEGDVIKVSDLGLNLEKYEIHLHQEDVIVTCSAPRAAVEEDDEEEVVVTGSDDDIASKEKTEEEK